MLVVGCTPWPTWHAMQNGASTEQGKVLVSDHIPKVKVDYLLKSHVLTFCACVENTSIVEHVYCAGRTSFRRSAGDIIQSHMQISWR